LIFVVSGPSGCGKSTIVDHVLKHVRNIHFSVSHTTRPKRNSEREGKDYYFVSRKEFERMITQKKFVEWAVVHGNYYGTSKREVRIKGKKGDIILGIDVQGAEQIRKKFKKAVFIFILPPDFKELRRRLEKRREDSPEAVCRRLEVSKKEVRHYSSFEYVIVNDCLDQAVSELESIILSTRCRLEMRREEIKPILENFKKSGDGSGTVLETSPRREK